MSSRDATKPQDLGPERLKPAQGTPTLYPSVAAEGPATDACTDHAPRLGARERILVWLAEGAREVTWALCSMPRERWAVQPPGRVGDWPALRHVHHLALQEAQQVLPSVCRVLGETSDGPGMQLDAAWDGAAIDQSADALVHTLAETRFELMRRLEGAPDETWARPLNFAAEPGTTLDWLLLNAHQHELLHLAAIWKIALNWDRPAPTAIPGVPLHPADRLEESH
jgi:hypothetical protein